MTLRKNIIESIAYIDLKGLRVHKLHSSYLRCFQIPRNLIKKLSDVSHIDSSGIYFLRNKETQSIYVGQSDNIKDRLLEHNRGKEFTSVIAIVSESNYLSKTFTDYLEYYYIDLLKKQDFWKLENKDQRNRHPNISEFEEAKLKSYIEDIDSLLSFVNLNLKIISPIKIKTEFGSNKDELIDSKEDIKDEVFFYKKVKIMYIDGELFMLKGSLIFNMTEEYIQKSNISSKDKLALFHKSLRWCKEWLSQGLAILLNDKEIELIVDIKINSPSLAAELGFPYPANGWMLFKNKDNKTLDEIYRK